MTYICLKIVDYAYAPGTVAGIGTTIGGSIVKEFFHFNRVEAISLVWLVGSLVTDVIITCSLVWYLVSTEVNAV